MTSPISAGNWYLFDMKVADILRYIEHCTGQPYDPCPNTLSEANKWHIALRKGLHCHLHLNVGMPGIEEPEHPLVENEAALNAALLLGTPRLQVILSGEWDRAVEAGLISQEQLISHEIAMAADMHP